MAEQISLRAYTEDIESMLRQSRVDEAIAHSAHILQFYPKNANIYRNLGRGLMRQARYDEAGEIFRRLLAAILDDFSAHYQLSVVYENSNQADQALWHVERAFDQQPNNKQVNDRMRELYKKFRNIEVEKIQLTAGAVAKQYLKSNMYDEALEVVERTLTKLPDRADLQLIRASTLWEMGQPVEGAEAALDILESFPYALEANRILSELWIDEDRPADAQRYLIRVDAIDPYLAYEIATDTDADNSHFLVNVLDFSQYTARLASSDDVPDWLQQVEESSDDSGRVDTSELSLIVDLDAGESEDDLGWIDDIDADGQPPQTPAKPVTADLSDLLPDDFTFPDSAGSDDTVDENSLTDLPDFDDDNDDLMDLLGELEDDALGRTGLTGLLGDDDYNPGQSNTSGLTGLLTRFEDDEDEEEDDLSWLNEVSDGNFDASDDMDNTVFVTPDADEDSDPMAWLDADQRIATGEMEQVNAESKASVDPDDPMAWLQDSGIEIDEDGEKANFRYIEDNDPVSLESRESDPMAWLNDSEIELDNDIAPEDSYAMGTMDFNAPNVDNPMAWLDDSERISTDDIANRIGEDDSADFIAEDTNNFIDSADDSTEVLTGQLLNLDDTLAEDDDDPMAWLAEDGVEFLDENTGAVQDDEAWLEDDDILDDMLNIAELTGTTDYEPFIGDDSAEIVDNELPWMAEDDSTTASDDMAWLNDSSIEIGDDDFAFEDETLEDDDDDPMAWLNEGGVELDEDDFSFEDETLEDDNDPMAWLNEGGVELDDEANITPAEASDELPWMIEDVETVADEFDFVDDTVDALDDFEIEPPQEESSLLNFLGTSDNSDAELDLGDIDFDEDDLFADSGVDWLNALDGDDTSAPEASIDEDVSPNDSLDWMTDDSASEDDSFDWDDGLDESDESLDWMAKMTDESSDDFGFEDEDNAESAELDWMAELSDDDFNFDDEEDAQPAEADWLAELGDSSDDDFGFDDEEDAQPAEADWLAELNDDSDDDFGFDAEAITSTDDAEDSFDDLADNIMEQMDSGTLGDSPEELDEFFQSAFAKASTRDDISDYIDDEPEAQPAEMDWLAEIGDESDNDDFGFEDEADVEPAEADWLAELDDESEEDDFSFEDESNLEPAEADWLADLGDDSDDDDFGFEDEADAQPAEADWLAELGDESEDDFSFEDESDAQPAEADWLADLGDDSDDDDFGFEDDSDAQPAEADWLAELDDDSEDDFSFEDESDAQPAEADWLAELGDESDDDFGFEDEDDVEPAEADWLAELDDDSEDDFSFDDGDEEEDTSLAEEVGWITDSIDDGDEEEDISLVEEVGWITDSIDNGNEDDASLAEEVGWSTDSLDDSVPVEASWLDGFDDELPSAEGEADDEDALLEEAGWITDSIESDDDFQVTGDPQIPDGVTKIFDDPEQIEADALMASVTDDPMAWMDDNNSPDEDDIEEAQPAEIDWDTPVDDNTESEWDVAGTGFTDQLETDDINQNEDLGMRNVTEILDDLDANEVEASDFGVNDSDDDWLEDVGVAEEDIWNEDYFDEYQDDDMNIASTGMSDMLDAIRTNRSDEPDIDFDDVEVDEPDWLKESSEQLPAVSDVSDSDNDFEDYPMEAEPLAEVDDPQESDDMPDYLTGLDDFEDDDSIELEPLAEFEDDFTDDDDPVELEPLADFEDDDSIELEPLAEFEDDFADESDFEDDLETVISEDDLNIFGEQTEQVAADNAPDWLNAMVPGLDLDFEAEDEGYLDQGFDEREQTLRERNINESQQLNADFDWLQDIVEEESGSMDALDMDDHSTPPPPPIDLPTRRVYQFSALPVWMRGDALDNLTQTPAAPVDAVPDYLNDFDEFEDDDYVYEDDIEDSFQFETDSMQVEDDSLNIEDDIATTVNEVMDVVDDEFSVEDDSIDIMDDEFSIEDDMMNVVDDEFSVEDDIVDAIDDTFNGDDDVVDDMNDDFPDFDDDFDLDDESKT
ncbi:MAG: hypothetical protein AAF846_15580 [Chloroflexota bacterium]